MRRLACALALCSLLAHTVCSGAEAGPDDEEFSTFELVSGKRTSREECQATRDAVWVEHAEGTECIRYYPSANVVGARRAAFFFHGDVLEGKLVIPGAYKDNHASTLRKTAENLAKLNGVPFILLGRPGAYGSSGLHTERRMLKEYLSINAAVDAIKARYGLTQVLLSGQSGGATAVGVLLTLGRTDVTCAAPASGGYDALARAKDIAMRSGQAWRGCDSHGMCNVYNVTDHAGEVASGIKTRIFIIGDPTDTNTAFQYQAAFAEKLRTAGHRVSLLEARASGPQHHGLSFMATRVLGWCNAGFDDERIAGLVREGALALHAKKPKAEAPDPAQE